MLGQISLSKSFCRHSLVAGLELNVGMLGVPLKSKNSAWLVAQNRCWTADHLARRQLDHPEVCPFCEQEETISHLLSEYAFAQQVWHSVLAHYGLQTITHPEAIYQFLDWFLSAAERVSVGEMKGAQSLM
uniref:Reverse transcriptase zinc-binding domain-containing protein n=1 Tax=Aegilops tauschii subsp. strangulata TaxID=200361 RepID=A0A453KD10_AEGTS